MSLQMTVRTVAPGRCRANVIVTEIFVWKSAVAPAASRDLSDA